MNNYIFIVLLLTGYGLIFNTISQITKNSYHLKYQCEEKEEINVTFQVEMTHEDLMGENVYVTGNFNEWGETQMFDASLDGIWSINIELEEGDTIQYKYKIGSQIIENPPDECTIGENNNRYFVLGNEDTVLDVVCFNNCMYCYLTIIKENALENKLKILTNPIRNQILLENDFIHGEKYELELINNVGKIMYKRSLINITEKIIEIDVNGIQNGLYFLKIQNESEFYLEKVVIQKY